MSNSTLSLTYRTKKTGTGTQDATKELEKFNGTIGGLKGALGALAGGTALGAVTAGLKFAINEAMEAERVMALTESTIEATGGAAGLTAAQVANMAGNLSQMTGIADDVIQSGQNMLLTFKEIKGDQFERATVAMNDMAVAMNGGSLEGLDLKSTAIQLGKALNDPIKGVTALTKVGVSFTQGQKDAIKAMVEMGDTAGAQAIILAELESEFGGAAEAAGDTLAGSMAKLQNAVSELAEELGTGLIPGLNDAAQAALLLMQWTDKINAAYGEQITRVEDTATTYEEYVAGVLAAAVAAQKLDQSWVNLHGAAVLSGEANKNITAGLGLLTEAQFLTRYETDEATRANDRMAVSLELTAEQLAATTATAYGYLEINDLLAEGLSGLTEKMIFNKAAMNLSDEAALQLGISMGLVDTRVLALNEALPALKAKYDANHDGTISATEAANGYTAAVQALTAALLAVPANVTSTVTTNFVNNGNQYGGPAGPPQGPIPQADGGDWLVTQPTLFLAGEAGPERAQFTPLGEPGNGGGGGGGDTFYVTINAAGASAQGVADLLNKDDIRRRTGARRS